MEVEIGNLEWFIVVVRVFGLVLEKLGDGEIVWEDRIEGMEGGGNCEGRRSVFGVVTIVNGT